MEAFSSAQLEIQARKLREGVGKNSYQEAGLPTWSGLGKPI
jgi:hypothetical protein